MCNGVLRKPRVYMKEMGRGKRPTRKKGGKER